MVLTKEPLNICCCCFLSTAGPIGFGGNAMKDRQETMRFLRWVYQWKWTWYVIAYLFCILMGSWAVMMGVQALSLYLFGEQFPAWFMIFLWMLWVVPAVLYTIYHYDRSQIREKFRAQGLGLQAK